MCAMALRRRLVAAPLLGALVLTSLLGAVAAPAYAASSSPSPTTTPLSPSGSPSAGNGQAVPLTFGIKPKDFGGQPRGSFRFLIAPGRGSNDAVSVYNLSNQPLVLRLYATDAYTNAQGSFAALTADKEPTGAGTWLKLLIPHGSGLSIPPRSRVDVPFLLDVPAGALPGDHAAAIVVSLRSKTENGSGTALAVDSRIAAQVNVRVAGEIAPAMTIENLASRYEGTVNPGAPGRAVVSFRVHNTGNVAQSGRIGVVLAGLGGLGSREIAAEIPLINPGSALEVEVPFEEVWPLVRYTAQVSLVPVATEGDPAAAPSDATTSFWAVPWAALGLFLAVLAISGLVAALLRRRRLPPTPVTSSTASSDDLLGV